MEERRLVQAFRNKTMAGNIKKKLAFDDGTPTGADTAEGSKTAARVEVYQMIIDKAQVLIPGGEMFKCKHDGRTRIRRWKR